jgi:hypothetical protein
MDSFDWLILIHEAAHAVVGQAVGMELQTVTKEPPAVRFARKPVVSLQAQMATGAAGPIAERLLQHRSPEDTFDASLGFFFERLGSESVDSVLAVGLAGMVEEDDVHILARLISNYSSRPRGMAQFRLARARAISILQDPVRWEEVEALARDLTPHGSA